MPSIAVLPFRDISLGKDQQYFCEGIAEEILNALAQIEGLRVASRTSSFRFRDEAISTIGEQLNVTTVLEGSVRKEGNAIRITAQLNNAVDGFHLWSKNYDRELKNIFALQDEIAQAITQVLHVKLMGEAGVPIVKQYTENLEAYDKYLLGRYHWNRRAVGLGDALMTAIEYFEQAITLDPNYALAYSGLADAYLVLPTKAVIVKPGDFREQVEEAAKKAIALGPDLAETHVSFGGFRWAYYFDYKGTEKEFRRAIELNPKYVPAHHFLANLLMLLGRFDEALAERRKVNELEPLSIHYNNELGSTLSFARQYNAAIQQLQRTLELDSNAELTWIGLGIVYLQAKKFEDATRAWVRWAELASENKEAIQYYVSLVEEHERTGEPMSPTPELESIFAKYRWIHKYLFAFLGQKEKTLASLEQAYNEGYYNDLYYMKIDPAYDFIRSEPRFIALIQKMGMEE